MHLPLLVQTWAQRSASGVPGPPASRSSTPSTIGIALVGSSPAGSTIGQASTHFPQRVQASSVASIRAFTAAMNKPPPSAIVRAPSPAQT